MLSSYLDQLERKASENGVDLADACRSEGIARTTLFRWRKGDAFPREATAAAIMRRIERMVRERATEDAAPPPAEAAA